MQVSKLRSKKVSASNYMAVSITDLENGKSRYINL